MSIAFLQVYWLNEKYKPRKPKYFNRVHTGYEWNKYNQTHYDQDNPPPKVVQGYKFNIFYPDLMDKETAPEYVLGKVRALARSEDFWLPYCPLSKEIAVLLCFVVLGCCPQRAVIRLHEQHLQQGGVCLGKEHPLQHDEPCSAVCCIKSG